MSELGKLSLGKSAELADLGRVAFFDGIEVVNGPVYEAGVVAVNARPVGATTRRRVRLECPDPR